MRLLGDQGRRAVFSGHGDRDSGSQRDGSGDTHNHGRAERGEQLQDSGVVPSYLAIKSDER